MSMTGYNDGYNRWPRRGKLTVLLFKAWMVYRKEIFAKLDFLTWPKSIHTVLIVQRLLHEISENILNSAYEQNLDIEKLSLANGQVRNQLIYSPCTNRYSVKLTTNRLTHRLNGLLKLVHSALFATRLRMYASAINNMIFSFFLLWQK